MAKKQKDLKSIMTKIYKRVDEKLKGMDAEHCGSTTCVAIIRREAEQTVVYVANTGDTRAILCNEDGYSAEISRVHKATDP